VRLKGYDYSSAGLYFITICIQDSEVTSPFTIRAGKPRPYIGANNEHNLNQIRQYIIDNPKDWDTDKENPKNK
jgi:hypothetical protein